MRQIKLLQTEVDRIPKERQMKDYQHLLQETAHNEEDQKTTDLSRHKRVSLSLEDKVR
jgi:dsRNA-specific ribonuclease